jgi:ketosteroid isomerase-like protein
MYEAAFNEATWDRTTLKELVVHEDSKFAWGYCRFTANFTPRGSKERLAFTSQGSFVLRKHGGEWKIAQEHYSSLADVPRVQRSND